jgi:hypothetical protein
MFLQNTKSQCVAISCHLVKKLLPAILFAVSEKNDAAFAINLFKIQPSFFIKKIFSPLRNLWFVETLRSAVL